MPEEKDKRPIGIGFWQYFRKVSSRAFKDSKWVRDMAIGACLSVATIALRAQWGMISSNDWRMHERQWIASIVLPIIAFMAIRVAYRILTAPWRVHQDQEIVHAEEMEELRIELGNRKTTIDKLMSPDDRPRLVFDRWGQIPADHPVAIQKEPTMVDAGGRPIIQFLQNGFHFINDGGPAHEVTVEPFRFEAFEANSAVVPRIGKEGGFALVYLAQLQPLQSALSHDRWDLQGAMEIADRQIHPSSSVHRPDYSVMVAVTYRDGNSVLRYRSTATLTYIRSQHRLSFGATSHEQGSLIGQNTGSIPSSYIS